MKILQLCIHSNLWHPSHQVTSIDLRIQSDIMKLPPQLTDHFDIICAAPPCDQFTRAGSLHWIHYPEHFILLASHCLNICLSNDCKWFLEQPPGRIEKFIPLLKSYRQATVRIPGSNKEYIIYGNFFIPQPHYKRYTGTRSENNKTKYQRELWHPYLIKHVSACLNID